MGSELHASLPWDQLSRRDDIPWSALHTFANAVIADRELTTRLFELYDRAYDNLPGGGAADFLVPGVFALAAHELDEPRRQEIGSLLIERIAQAGQDNDFPLMEILTAAAGTMGPDHPRLDRSGRRGGQRPQELGTKQAVHDGGHRGRSGPYGPAASAGVPGRAAPRNR